MVRKVWVWIALVAGLVAGFGLATYGAHLFGFGSAESDGRPAMTAMAGPGPPAAGLTDSPAMATAAPALAGVDEPPAIGRPAASPVKPSEPAAAAPRASNLDSISVRYVDALPVPPQEHVDPLHEEFLQEVRDDNWAYLREAELENAMVMELSEGQFKKERIECRASICEVELSASGEQVARLYEWVNQKDRQRGLSPDVPLMMRGSSFRGDGTSGSARILYMKPERALRPAKRS